jgi:hypothetical protein
MTHCGRSGLVADRLLTGIADLLGVIIGGVVGRVLLIGRIGDGFRLRSG